MNAPANPYYPRPGTVAYRVLALLEQQQGIGKLSLGAIAGSLNTGAASVLSSIEQAIAVGLIVRTTPTHQDRPGLYHVDREVLARTRTALKLEPIEAAAVSLAPPAETAPAPTPPRAAQPHKVALLVDLKGSPPKHGGLLFALWSDGTFDIVRRASDGDDLLLTLSREEMQQLVGYLDAISLDSVRGGS